MHSLWNSIGCFALRRRESAFSSYRCGELLKVCCVIVNAFEQLSDGKRLELENVNKSVIC